MGFLVGLEVTWLPHLLRIIREEAPEIEVTLYSQSSPELALALMRGKLDVAFLRPEKQSLGLSFKLLAKEPLIAVLPAGHRLASRKKIRPQDLAREIYVSSARTSPVLQSVIQDYASRPGSRSRQSTKARTYRRQCRSSRPRAELLLSRFMRKIC